MISNVCFTKIDIKILSAKKKYLVSLHFRFILCIFCILILNYLTVLWVPYVDCWNQ